MKEEHLESVLLWKLPLPIRAYLCPSVVLVICNLKCDTVLWPYMWSRVHSNWNSSAAIVLRLSLFRPNLLSEIIIIIIIVIWCSERYANRPVDWSLKFEVFTSLEIQVTRPYFYKQFLRLVRSPCGAHDRIHVRLPPDTSSFARNWAFVCVFHVATGRSQPTLKLNITFACWIHKKNINFH